MTATQATPTPATIVELAPTHREVIDALAVTRGSRGLTVETLVRRICHRKPQTVKAAVSSLAEHSELVECRDGRVRLTRRARAALRELARIDKYVAEVARRGGETEIVERNRTVELVPADERAGLLLLHAEGWRRYGGGRDEHATLSYLVGDDESGLWAVRVPGTIRTVTGALAWIEPAEVRDALRRGLRVLRQGDVYAVEMARKDRADLDAIDLPESHRWDSERRILSHDGHGDLHVPFPARFVRQRALEMGRSGRYDYGD